MFTTRDPLDGVNGTPTVSNPYHYVDNDPLNFVDPMGLRPSDDSDFDPDNFDVDPGTCLIIRVSCLPLGIGGGDQQVHVSGDIWSSTSVAIYLPSTCQSKNGEKPNCGYRHGANTLREQQKDIGYYSAVISWLGYKTGDSGTEGLPRVRLTSHVWGSPTGEDGCHAQEAPTRVLGRCGSGGTST